MRIKKRLKNSEPIFGASKSLKAHFQIVTTPVWLPHLLSLNNFKQSERK